MIYNKYNKFVYAHTIYSQRKKSFIKIPEVININFPQIWHFEVKDTGWVGLELSIILTQTVGRFDMWVTPYTTILTFTRPEY